MVLQLEKKFPTLCWLIMIYIYYWKLLNRGKGVYQCIMCWTVWSVNNTTYVNFFLSFQYTKNVDNLILSVLNNLTFYSSRKVIKANSGKVVHVIKFDSVQCYCWWPLATCCDGWLVACENLGDNCDLEWKRRLAICNLWWQRLIWCCHLQLAKTSMTTRDKNVHLTSLLSAWRGSISILNSVTSIWQFLLFFQ